MNQELAQTVVSLCKLIAEYTPIWTQGKGGNVSAKSSAAPNQLVVKASGFKLSDVSMTSGLAVVDLQKFRSGFMQINEEKAESESEYNSLIEACSSKENGLKRASMEVGFHAMSKASLVLHFHSLAAVLMAQEFDTSPKKFMQFMSEFDFEFEVLDLVMPGLMLSKEISKFEDVEVFLLKNHGVVLCVEDAMALKRWLELEQKFCLQFGYSALYKLYQSKDQGEDKVLIEARKQVAHHSNTNATYFPDAAVFRAKIEETAKKMKMFGFNFQSCPEDFWLAHAETLELMLAGQLLNSYSPQLPEVSAKFSEKIIGLPTEKARMEVQK